MSAVVIPVPQALPGVMVGEGGYVLSKDPGQAPLGSIAVSSRHRVLTAGIGPLSPRCARAVADRSAIRSVIAANDRDPASIAQVTAASSGVNRGRTPGVGARRAPRLAPR